MGIARLYCAGVLGYAAAVWIPAMGVSRPQEIPLPLLLLLRCLVFPPLLLLQAENNNETGKNENENGKNENEKGEK